MKVGDKYIIEIEEVIRRNGAPQIARIKGFNGLVFDKCGLEKLEPYSWEKTYVHGYKDGKKAVKNESEKITSKDISDAYNKGLNDAWECARKIIGGMHSHNDYIKEKRNVIFGTFDRGVIMHRFSASEAIAKIKEYEDKQKQDAEIKVGDEVIFDNRVHAVVFKVVNNIICKALTVDGIVCDGNMRTYEKTGRHFDQISEVLAELRGEE